MRNRGIAPHQNGLVEAPWDVKLVKGKLTQMLNKCLDRTLDDSCLQKDHLNSDASALEEQDPQQEHARAHQFCQHALGALMQQDLQSSQHMLAGATTWARLRGHLYKVATTNVQKAPEDEVKSVKAANEVVLDLQTAAIEQQGRRRFTDVSIESPWEEPESSTAAPSRV
eukprot:6323381-Amphidinium_carterae.3